MHKDQRLSGVCRRDGDEQVENQWFLGQRNYSTQVIILHKKLFYTSQHKSLHIVKTHRTHNTKSGHSCKQFILANK